MKCRHNTASEMIIFALLLLSTGVTLIDAECSFCINATIIDPTLEVGGGETCASLSEAAPTLEAEEFLCADVALAAQVDCCPSFNVTAVEVGSIINPTFNETFENDDNTGTATTTCSFCAQSGGIAASAENTVIPFAEANGSTCAQTFAYAQIIVDASDICTTMKDAESVCCPPPASDPCRVCAASGIDAGVDGATPIFDGAMKTCDDVVVDALTVEEGSDLCAQMKVAEETCCPSESNNATTTTLAPSSSSSSSSPSAAPIANDTESVVSSSLAPTMAPSLNDGTMIPTTSNETTTTTSSSSNATTTTCQVCLDGIAAGNEDIVIGQGKTCANLIADAALTDANDVGCSMMQDAQLTCCPTPAEVPCDVCPDGIAVDEGTAITAAKTCGDLMVDAQNTEAESDTCSGMKAVAEPICCPNATDTNTNTTTTASPETMTNNSTTTTMPSGLETTLAPSGAAEPEADNATTAESLAPTAATTTATTSGSPESSSSTSSPTTAPVVLLLGATTPSPSLVATSTTDDVAISSFLPTSLAPTNNGLLEGASDKDPLAFEASSGGAASSSSGSSSRTRPGCSSFVPRIFFAIVGYYAMSWMMMMMMMT